MSSPLGKIATPEPANLEDIISEELTRNLKLMEDNEIIKKDVVNFDILPKLSKEGELVKSNERISKNLQNQHVGNTPGTDISEELMDDLQVKEHKKEAIKEDMLNFDILPELEDELFEFDEQVDKIFQKHDEQYNENIKHKEKSHNSEVTVSNSNNQEAFSYDDYQSDSEEDTSDDEHGDRFNPILEEFEATPAYKIHSLKFYSKHEQHPKKYKTQRKKNRGRAVLEVDVNARKILYQMMKNKQLDGVKGVIAFGKEAVVLHGIKNPYYIPCYMRDCIIKVYKTTLSEHKPRDKDMMERYGKINPTKMVHLWAEREMRVLQRVKNAGILCPYPLYLKENVLAMSFIGHDQIPARTLKCATLEGCQKNWVYDQVINDMKLLFSKCNLIHGDLTENNILFFCGNCYYIDFGQAVEVTDRDSSYYLYRDCQNISNFFTKLDVPNVATPKEIFFDITGCNYGDRLALQELREKIREKNKRDGKS